MIPNYITCVPSKPDAKCNNCKRRLTKTKTQVHVVNSKDKACIYIPISFQELPMETENRKPKSSGMECCTYDCIQGRNCPVRNKTLEEVAKEIDKMPFGDTAQSFARFIRNMKS